MVETCLPGDDLDVQTTHPSSLGIASNLNLSSSMSSLSVSSLHSPTDGDLTASMSALASNMSSSNGSNVLASSFSSSTNNVSSRLRQNTKHATYQRKSKAGDKSPTDFE